ncbi:MAG: helix-turn-helix transcriptional regulator [Gammaproteobacteria bacterium]|nr:helix-turn-helix transcriptional regulator [Gammaproteobacteria bacterium]
MKIETAVERLAALAQASRIEAFRKLIQAGPQGLAAGVLAETLAIPKPTLSFHLAQLEHAGLIRSQRLGRSIIYRADYAAIAELLGFMSENCCGTGVALAAAAKPARRK